MNLQALLLFITHGALIVVSTSHAERSHVDLDAPIDLRKDLREPARTKAKVVIVNNRKEARLPFHDPRKQFRNLEREKNRNLLESRREGVHSIREEDRFRPRVSGDRNLQGNSDVLRQDTSEDERRYRPRSESNQKRIALEREREIEREVNKALRHREELRSQQSNKFDEHSPNKGDNFNDREQLVISDLIIGEEQHGRPSSHRSNTRFDGHEASRDSFPSQTSGSETSSRRHGENWNEDQNFQKRISTPIISVVETSAGGHVTETRQNRRGSDRRKPPILIFEEVPVYVSTDNGDSNPVKEESKPPLDHYYEPDRSGGEQEHHHLDRRPDRFNSDGDSYIITENDELPTSHHDIYQSDVYDNPPEFYESFPSNIFEENSSPHEESSGPGYHQEVYYSHPHDIRGSPAPAPGTLVHGQPLPYSVQDAIVENVAFNSFPSSQLVHTPYSPAHHSHSPGHHAPSPAQLAFQQRLQAEALAVGALQQQAVAGLALNHRLQQIAAIRGLQQAAAEAHARETTAKGGATVHEVHHYEGPHYEEPGTEFLHPTYADLHHSASSSDTHASYGTDDGVNIVHDQDELEALVHSELKDTITNQIKKHIDRIIANEGLDAHIDQEELIKHLLFLRPHFSKEDGGFETPYAVPDAPLGSSVSNGEAADLPTIVLQPIHVTTERSPLDFSKTEAQKDLPPSIDMDFVEFILSLPDEHFQRLVHTSKRQFLSVMFPRLYRHPPTTSPDPSSTTPFTFSTPAPYTITTPISIFTSPASLYGLPNTGGRAYGAPEPVDLSFLTSGSSYSSYTTPPSVFPPDDGQARNQLPLQEELLRVSDWRGAHFSEGTHHTTAGTTISPFYQHHTTTLKPVSTGFRFPGEGVTPGPLVSHRGTPTHAPSFRPSQQDAEPQVSSYSTPRPTAPHSSYGVFQPVVITTTPAPGYGVVATSSQSPGQYGGYGVTTSPRTPLFTSAIAFTTPQSDEGGRPFGSSTTEYYVTTSTLSPVRGDGLVFSSSTPRPDAVDQTLAESEYKYQQPFYTTTKPTIFHSTITRPRSTTFKPDFSVDNSLSQTPDYGRGNDNQFRGHSTNFNFPNFSRDTTDFENSRENNLVEEIPLRNIPGRIPHRPSTLIGGFEGTLRPLSAPERVRELEARQAAAVNSLASAPGTDTNDDQHTLTPFQRRTGNTTTPADVDNQMPSTLPVLVPNFQYQEIPSVVKFAPPTQASPSGEVSPSPPSLQLVINSSPGQETTFAPRENPQNFRTGDTTLGEASTTFRPDTATTAETVRPVTGGRIPPSPQRVDLTGLPSIKFHGGTVGSGAVAATGEDLAAAKEELIKRLPPYLRQPPPCAGTGPAQRSFCLLDADYPSDTAEKVFTANEEELAQLQTLLKEVDTHSVNLEEASQQIPGIDPNVSCEVEQRTVLLGWARDVLGNWLAVLHTDSFPQPLTVSTCSASARAKGCRPLLLPRPMAAFHPKDTEPRPMIGNFPVPITCVYASEK